MCFSSSLPLLLQRPFSSAHFIHQQNCQSTFKLRILTDMNVQGQIFHCVLHAESHMKYNEKQRWNKRLSFGKITCTLRGWLHCLQYDTHINNQTKLRTNICRSKTRLEQNRDALCRVSLPQSKIKSSEGKKELLEGEGKGLLALSTIYPRRFSGITVPGGTVKPLPLWCRSIMKDLDGLGWSFLSNSGCSLFQVCLGGNSYLNDLIPPVKLIMSCEFTLLHLPHNNKVFSYFSPLCHNTRQSMFCLQQSKS